MRPQHRITGRLLALALVASALLVGLWCLDAGAPASTQEAASSDSRAGAVEGAGGTSARTNAALSSQAASATPTQLDVGPESSAREHTRPEIRGYLLDSLTGLPLEGHTIELRARRAAEPRVAQGATLELPNPIAFTAPDGTASIVYSGGIEPGVMRWWGPHLEAAATGGQPEVQHQALDGLISRALTLRGMQFVTTGTGAVEVAAEAQAAQGELSEQPAAEPAAEPAGQAVVSGEVVYAPPTEEAVPAQPETAALEQAELHVAQAQAEVQQALVIHLLAAQEPASADEQEAARAAMARASQTLELLSERIAAGQQRRISTKLQFLGALKADYRAAQDWNVSFRMPPQVVTLASAVTDERGFFRFDCPADAEVFLELVPREHDYLAKPTYAFREPEHMCDREFDWRVPLQAGSAVRGRVLDLRTQEPVAGLTVELSGAQGWSETVETDDAGRFASSTNCPAGALRAEAYDGSEEDRIGLAPSEFALTGRERAEDEFVLLASLGPTWPLRFQEQHDEVDGEGKRLLVFQEREASSMRVRLVGAEPWEGWQGSGNPFAAWRAVSSGERGFVRSPVAPRAARGSFWAEFQSDDQEWAGSAELFADPAGQEVTLQRTASIAGRLTREQGGAGLRVRACRYGGGEAAVYELTECEEDGGFELAGLDVGAVRCLEILDGTTLLRRIDLTLLPGETREFALEL